MAVWLCQSSQKLEATFERLQTTGESLATASDVKVHDRHFDAMFSCSCFLWRAYNMHEIDSSGHRDEKHCLNPGYEVRQESRDKKTSFLSVTILLEISVLKREDQ